MILAIDTSTLQSGAALVSTTGDVLASRRARVTTHSESLLSLIDELFVETHAHPSDLVAIACGAGPGSFTGLRIGLSTAKGLCFALGRPLVMVSSLQAMARRAPRGALAVACIDAFKGEVYAGFYRAAAEPVAANFGAAEGDLHAEVVMPPDRLGPILAQLMLQEAVHLIADTAELTARFPDLLAPGVIVCEAGSPDPGDVGRIAALRLSRGETDDLAATVPRYLRASEAELKFGPAPLPSLKFLQLPPK